MFSPYKRLNGEQWDRQHELNREQSKLANDLASTLVECTKLVKSLNERITALEKRPSRGGGPNE